MRTLSQALALFNRVLPPGGTPVTSATLALFMLLLGLDGDPHT
jgi:hypothetical protein